MGRSERRTESREKGDPFASAETALKAVTEELQIIQRNLLKSLQEDLKRLQAEKSRLIDDIKRLQEKKEIIQHGRQITEQQELVRQLAQVLAHHITSQLQSSLETLTAKAMEHNSMSEASPETDPQISENVNQLLGSLDDTLTITFNTLQQELKNYQSSLSQQLSRMSVQQQQGEVILAELVNRLRGEIEPNTPPDFPITELQEPNNPVVVTRLQPDEISQPTQIQVNAPEVTTQLQPKSTQIQVNAPEVTTQLQPNSISQTEESQEPTTRSETSVSPVTLAAPKLDQAAEKPNKPKQSPFQQVAVTSLPALGILFVVLATVVMSLYNVAIKVVVQRVSLVFGVFEAQQLLLPSLGNSLLILLLRMLIVVPLMILLAPILYPRVWQDLDNLLSSVRAKATSNSSATQRILFLSVVSGSFLFLSQVLIFLAIGQVPTGMAIALFFIYPALNGLLSWSLFGDRFTLFGGGAITAICLGEVLVLGGAPTMSVGDVSFGSTTAIASGMAFTGYVILTRMCAAKVHPVSFTLINFATMLLLSFVGVLAAIPMGWQIQFNPAQSLELILSAFILGALTLVSYLLNNFGIRKIGATRAAIFGATVPALTVIFAGLIIQETLQHLQILGILLITGGSVTLSWEKVRNRFHSQRSVK